MLVYIVEISTLQSSKDKIRHAEIIKLFQKQLQPTLSCEDYEAEILTIYTDTSNDLMYFTH